MKIIIVEDNEETLKIVKRALTLEGYEVIEATDGEEGYEKTYLEDPDLMILDLNLPKMDGIELCKKLRDEGKNLPIIMLTGRREAINRVKGLQSGADDYIEKPFNIKELLQRVEVQLRHIYQAQLEAERLLRKRWEEINEGLLLISTTHKPYFHIPEVPGIKAVVHYLPFGKIGGDFYRITRFADGTIGILIGDAMGKGLVASFIMASTFAMLNRLMKENRSPRDIFVKCNKLMREDFKELENYVSSFLAFYFPEQQKLIYASAGHQPPILIRKSGFHHHVLDTEGYFLGAFNDGEYEEKEIDINKGDRLFLYTDGLIDIRDKNNKQIDFKQFYREILKNKDMDIEQLSNYLIEKYRRYTGGEGKIRDDLIFFFVEF